MDIEIKRLSHAMGLPLPQYQTLGSAGMDLPAAIENTKVISPGERVLIPTGFSLALPPSIEAQIRPRSGLAFKNGVTVLNAPGTIDSDYRGEISILLINHGSEPFVINRGDRIAQMVIAQVAQPRLVEVKNLSKTVRGEGGYGSTGANISIKIGAPQHGTD
jgi:dUTP pyrophosphatase